MRNADPLTELRALKDARALAQSRLFWAEGWDENEAALELRDIEDAIRRLEEKAP